MMSDITEPTPEKKYNLPLSTPKGSDLDWLLKDLIAGIKNETIIRRGINIDTDVSRPGWFEVRIEFCDISEPHRVIDEPDMARSF